MKLTIALLVGALALLVVVSVVILWLATPQPWPISPGTLTVEKVAFDGQSYVEI
jgi:cell division septal protein FtsQ